MDKKSIKCTSLIVIIVITSILSSIIAITLYSQFYDKDNKSLTENEAISILNAALETDDLNFFILGEENYMGEDSFSIKAFYDEGDHTTTEGVYIVQKYSHEIYMLNMYGEGYIRMQ